MTKRFPMVEDFHKDPAAAVRAFRESTVELVSLLTKAQTLLEQGSEARELLRDANDIAVSLQELDDFSFVKGMPDQSA